MSNKLVRTSQRNAYHTCHCQRYTSMSHVRDMVLTRSCDMLYIYSSGTSTICSLAKRRALKMRTAFKTFASKEGKLRPFRLLSADVVNLKRRYFGDWTIFNTVVLSSAVFVFFTNLLPGITFASELYDLTGQQWGTIEIVLSTGICNAVFSLFGLQPLTILGVTGSFTVIAEHLHNLVTESMGKPYLPFMAWSLFHSCWMLWALAIFNAHEWSMLYVTEFTCEVFSLLNSIIYFSKALQEFRRSHGTLPLDAFLFSVIDAVGTFLLALMLSTAESWTFFPRWIRRMLRQYGTAIAVITFVALGYIGDAGRLQKNRLSTSTDRFAPSSPERSGFFVQFWELDIGSIFASMLSGAIIAMLFFFDHEISTIIATAKWFGIQKPNGFALEIMLLGATTALCGLLGIPPANGLLPQAPLHTQSLLYPSPDEVVEEVVRDSNGIEHTITRPVYRVHEQRWSKIIHAGGILACIAPPLQRVLGFTPKSVLAGLFIFMGQQSLASNPILRRTLNMLTPKAQLPPPYPGVRYWGLHSYTLFQIFVTIMVFIMTLTIAGPAFPIVILGLVPFRLLVMPRIWSREVLRHLDRWSCRDGHPDDVMGDKSSSTPDQSPGVPLLPSLVFSELDMESARLTSATRLDGRRTRSKRFDGDSGLDRRISYYTVHQEDIDHN
ncbi:putative transporter [Cercospora beticola]|nr:putative transporter [Cercospora beticola]PIA97947.1 putative transporter [Cercospora beticola]